MEDIHETAAGIIKKIAYNIQIGLNEFPLKYKLRSIEGIDVDYNEMWKHNGSYFGKAIYYIEDEKGIDFWSMQSNKDKDKYLLTFVIDKNFKGEYIGESISIRFYVNKNILDDLINKNIRYSNVLENYVINNDYYLVYFSQLVRKAKKVKYEDIPLEYVKVFEDMEYIMV